MIAARTLLNQKNYDDIKVTIIKLTHQDKILTTRKKL